MHKILRKVPATHQRSLASIMSPSLQRCATPDGDHSVPCAEPDRVSAPRILAPRWQSYSGASPEARATAGGPAGVAAEVLHPYLRRLLEKVEPEVCATLSDAQLVALSRATLPEPSPHLVQYRVSIPFGRFYVALFIGRERRSRERLRREGQTRAELVNLALFLMGALLVGIATIAIVVGLYIVKSAMGIDILDGPSPFHEWLYSLLERTNHRGSPLLAIGPLLARAG